MVRPLALLALGFDLGPAFRYAPGGPWMMGGINDLPIFRVFWKLERLLKQDNIHFSEVLKQKLVAITIVI